MKLCLGLLSLGMAALGSLEAKSPGEIETFADQIYTVSSFESMDYFCVHNSEGELAWEIPFRTKVLSWKICEDTLFVFSQHRQGKIYFLSCMDAKTGDVHWEKGVYAPDTVSDSLIFDAGRNVGRTGN